ncbi:MAG: alpha/beta fold hydrolase [Candidatus Dormibacteraeota bacterium]|nr:alpha/beta fold hydrolase [Candidatus Dormibacteraeota bacterium]
MEERFTTYRGERLRYLVGGEGPLLLACHGFIGSAENFNDWFAALLPRRTVVAPDLPGFGESAPLHIRHTAMALGRAGLAAVDDSGLAGSRFDVAGLCLGSSVALAVQRLRPDRVDRVVLHTPLLAPSLVRRRFHAQVAVMMSNAVFPGIVWLARQRRVSDLYKRLMVEGSGVDATAALVNFENQLRADAAASRQWLRDGLRRDDLAQVVDSRAPTLVMVAADDRIVDVARSRTALAGAPAVQLAVLEEGGHAWTAAMIEVQQALLAAFLDGRPLPGALSSGAAA